MGLVGVKEDSAQSFVAMTVFEEQSFINCSGKVVSKPASFFPTCRSPISHLHSMDITFRTFGVIIIQVTYPDLRETRDYVHQFNQDQRYYSDIRHYRTFLINKDWSLRYFPKSELKVIFPYTKRFSHISINP